MASISPSSSPRWDNRNTGFVSPSQLQLLKQQEEQQRQHQQQLFQHHRSSTAKFPEQREQPTPARAEQGQPTMFRTTSRQDIAPAPPVAHTHSRTTSAFSFFKTKANHNHTPSTPSLPHATGEHGELRSGQGPYPSPSTSSKEPMPPGPPPNPSSEQPFAPGLATNNRGTPASKPPAGAPSPEGLPPLHPEIRSIVQLTVAQTQKVYFSGPLVRRVERQPDGQRSTKDGGWREVWAQLGGTTLSVWDMKEIEEASKQGRQVPPSYVNVTDAFIEVLGSVTTPASPTSPSQKYTNILTLNNAGSNLLLFACPSTQALLSWAAAMRLSAWEKSRLEEIYSAHLIRITLNDGRDTPTPLNHGRMEGWVRIRVAGQTDWKRLWMVVTAGVGSPTPHEPASSEAPTVLRKKRISSLFGRDQSPPRASSPRIPALQLFASNKPKDKKKPVLSMCKVTQAFAVYPERPELISRSTLMKIEGTLGEELSGAMQSREGWLLVMPELEGNNTRASEMLKWLTGIHDAFELYGRPRMYNWDPRDPRSMMFAYPIGPNKDMLFLDRELAETLDPTDARTSTTRAQLQRILWERMGGSPEQSQSPIGKHAPTLPPLPEMSLRTDVNISEQLQASGSRPLQLPPLQFETSRVEQDLPEIPLQLPRTLTPITEKSDPRHSRPGSNEGAIAQPSHSPPTNGSPEQGASTRSKEEVVKPTSFFGDVMTTSPVTSSPPPIADFHSDRRSEDSFAMGTLSRPDSKLSHFPVRQPTSPTSHQRTLDSTSSYTQNTDRDRQSPALASPHPFSITPPPPILAAAKPSSRPASPRPSIPTSRQSQYDSTRAASPNFSILSSPHSVAEPQSPVAVRRHSRLSLMQESPPSPSALGHGRNVSGSSSLAIQPHPPDPTSKLATQPAATLSSPPPPQVSSPTIVHPSEFQAPAPPSKDDSSPQLLHEAGALYYMRLQQGEASGPRRQPPPPPDDNDESTSSDESTSLYNPTPAGTTQTNNGWATTPPRFASPSATSPNAGATSSYFPPQTFTQGSTPTSSGQSSGKPGVARPAVSPGSGVSHRGSRRPTGARAVPVSKTAHRELAPAITQQNLPPPPAHVDEEDGDDNMSDDEQNSEERGPRLLPPRLAKAEAEAAHDDQHGAADMLAALSFLERAEPPSPPPVQSPTLRQAKSPPPVPQLVEPRTTSPTPSVQGSLRSSFAPSRKAEERKAKSQAQQAAYEAAVHKPGRAHGRQKKMRDAGAWGESSDEEEEEDEEEDEEDADSDAEPPRRDGGRMDQRSLASPGRSGGRAVSPGGPVRDGSPASQYRPPRDLPPVPMGQGYLGMGPGPGPSALTGSDDNLAPQPRRFVSDQFSEAGRRSMYPDSQRRQPSPQPQARGQPEYLQPGAARHNMWSQVLERDPAALPESNSRDTFVQLEPASQTMTKAFAPHGLLSAGLQDKQDRSAKRQEELARETGASLINVPHKPPPPQTGLLGAVTAHERERKREGGLGATLTERERERRLAEERQRKLDEFQRMQLDQMQQTGSMYGGMGMPQFTGYNPMMGNPMMMGMNPMMNGGWGGYPGMMNPQHMFAAQQAAQAYQQAMAAFSTAGSQVGGDPGNVPQMNPMMTGAMSFDPRMSMMGMPMLSPSMTGMGAMNPAMGMGGMGGMGGGVSPMGTPMGMGQMGMGGMGMNPQMTGGSAFDARYSPGNDGGLRAPSDAAGSRPYSQNSSAHGQGSPAGGPRPLDGGDDTKKPSAGIR